MTKIYIDVYLHLLTKRNGNEDIAIGSTRFFLDVKSHRISAEIFRAFRLNEHVDMSIKTIAIGILLLFLQGDSNKEELIIIQKHCSPKTLVVC